jgi:hypothetical protein
MLHLMTAQNIRPPSFFSFRPVLIFPLTHTVTDKVNLLNFLPCDHKNRITDNCFLCVLYQYRSHVEHVTVFKITVFWDLTSCSPFDPEDVGDMFFRNIG